MACSEQPGAFRFVDIGANLTDPVFQGRYRGKQLHPNDFQDVMQRAEAAGVARIIVTGGSLSESRQAVALCRDAASGSVQLHCTVGCHPTRSKEMDAKPDEYVESLRRLVCDNRDVVVAIGETGLDYDREQFADRTVQMRSFRRQLSLACDLQLPLFLHCRASHDDFFRAVADFAERLPSPPGVVHTFDGGAEDARRLLEAGFFLGLNGCSLRKPENLAVVADLPLGRLMLETDAPWCEVKRTHAGYGFVRDPAAAQAARKPERWVKGQRVRGRNEPACIVQVLQVVAGAIGRPEAEVAAAAFENAQTVFKVSQ